MYLEMLSELSNGTSSNRSLTLDDLTDTPRNISLRRLRFARFVNGYDQVRHNMCSDLHIGLNECREEAEDRVEGYAGNQRRMGNNIDVL